MGVRVAIAGIGIHPFGRHDGVSNTEMGVSAVRAALTEAGHPAFQAAFCGTAYGGVASGHKVLGALALTGVPIVDVEAGCASGGAALQLAAGAIRAGQYDCVLVFGVVELVAERLRIVTRLQQSDPSSLTFGQAMSLVADELPGGVVTWAFA